MKFYDDLKRGLADDFKESWQWASVRLMAFWGFVVAYIGSAPPEVLQYLTQTKVIGLPLLSWIGFFSFATTYFGRMKKPEVK